MSALEDLKTYLLAEADKINNALDKLEVKALIDSWYPCRQEVDALRSTDIQSYTVNQRSVMRQRLQDMELSEARMYQRIQDFLYLHGIALVDARGFYVSGWPTSGGSVGT